MPANPIFWFVVAIFLSLAAGYLAAYLEVRRRRRLAEFPRMVPAAPEISADDPDRQFYDLCIAAGFRWVGEEFPDKVRYGMAGVFAEGQRIFARVRDTQCTGCRHRLFDLYVMDKYLSLDRSSIRTGPCLFARVCGHCGLRQEVDPETSGPDSPRIYNETFDMRMAGNAHTYLAQHVAARREAQGRERSSAESPA